MMTAVKSKELTLVQAAEAMGVSYRQAKRIWKRYQKAGDAGLIHCSRGRIGSRRIEPEQRQKILRRFRQRYSDFGPTLAAEYLTKDGWEVDHETLRRWLLEEGLWRMGRARQKHRQWRERKACFGQMVQMDGSHHDWFEGRREKAVLMVMVDDASNRTGARFSEQETTGASYDVFERWTRHHGVPFSLYVDRDSIYRCERVSTVAEQVAGQEPQTQFGRAMRVLGVELILANSPQAKGRVERRNGVLQDRLVKALRLEGISDLKRANEYLEKEFLPEFNLRFMVEASSAGDLHRAVTGNLEEVLCWEEERVVRKDWTVVWEGRWFQIDRQHENLSLANRRIALRRLRSDEVQILYQGRKLRWKELPDRPQRVKPLQVKTEFIGVIKPAPEHPWRRFAAAGERKRQAIQSRQKDAWCRGA
jgi:transposase